MKRVLTLAFLLSVVGIVQGQISNLALAKANRVVYVDGEHYPLDDRGVSDAIRDAGQAGTVILPAGALKFSATVVLPSDITLKGAGRASTVVTHAGTGPIEIFTIPPGATRIVLSDLTIQLADAETAFAVMSSYSGITSYNTFRNLLISAPQCDANPYNVQLQSTGISLINDTNTNIINNSFSDIDICNIGRPIVSSGSYYSDKNDIWSQIVITGFGPNTAAFLPGIGNDIVMHIAGSSRGAFQNQIGLSIGTTGIHNVIYVSCDIGSSASNDACINDSSSLGGNSWTVTLTDTPLGGIRLASSSYTYASSEGQTLATSTLRLATRNKGSNTCATSSKGALTLNESSDLCVCNGHLWRVVNTERACFSTSETRVYPITPEPRIEDEEKLAHNNMVQANPSAEWAPASPQGISAREDIPAMTKSVSWGLNTPNVWTAPNSFANLNNERNANLCQGSDIFARANACAASLHGPGTVLIPAGVYSNVSTTLQCRDDLNFVMAGVLVLFSGKKSAIEIRSVNRCKITGPLHLRGTRAAGSVGLYLGNSQPRAGMTTENEISGVTIGDTPGLGASNGFDVGIRVDGNVDSGTYYNKFDRVSSNGNLREGWLIRPTLAARANSNRCLACTATSNGQDNFQIDGANFWTFVGTDSEAAGACGFDFPGSQITGENTIIGGDFEENANADFCFSGRHHNVSDSVIEGMSSASHTSARGLSNSLKVVFLPMNTAGNVQYVSGTVIDQAVGSATTSNDGYALNIRDSEAADAHILAIRRTGKGKGEVSIGTPGYPVLLGGVLKLSTVTATCNAERAGTLTYVAGGVGVKDRVQVCAKDATDNWAWRPIY